VLNSFAPADLAEYSIPNSVTRIGNHAFQGCSNLTSANISNSVTWIGDSAFEGCSNLTSVKISNKYCYEYFKDKISYIAFWGANASADGRCLIKDGKLEVFIAEGVTEYTIPDRVKIIGNNVFSECSNLTSIAIGNGVTSISDKAFAGCSLTSVKVSNKYCYEYFKDKISDIAFWGANATKGAKKNVYRISDIAFWGSNATADGRCLITDGMLEGCIVEGRTEYTIPSRVKIIGDNVFTGCSSLKSITIPYGVRSIRNNAFSECPRLERITCLATTPPVIDILDIPNTTIIYVVKDAIKAYKKDPNWMKYKKQIKPIK
jgi:hypothetical protein